MTSRDDELKAAEAAGSDRPRYEIRKATESDLPQIAALVRSVRIHPRRLDWRHIWVAVAPGDGVIFCVQAEPRPGGMSEVNSVAAMKKWQGRGIAAAVGARLIKEHQGPLVGACMRRMIPFYEKFGAKEITSSRNMPFSLRWSKRLGNVFLMLAGKRDRIAIMALK